MVGTLRIPLQNPDLKASKITVKPIHQMPGPEFLQPSVFKNAEGTGSQGLAEDAPQ
tara:strand:+ start:3293 stop:3460 length:168 start_codon:yes stop_codon:yes gene_type:complete